MTPRDFQRRAMASVGDRFRGGAMATLLVSPTGSGKTVMGAMMAAALVADGKRVAWGAHREELLLQSARTLRAFGLEVGMRGVNPAAPMQLGSYQEWAARGDAPDVDYFFADEAHHMGDRVGWQRITSAYKAAGKRIVGLTASPARGDGRSLPDFDALVVAAQIRELQELGLLVPLRWRGPGAGLSRGRIARTPVDAYLEEARGRCAVVFAPNKVSAAEYLAGFRSAGIRSAMVMGDMSDEDRADALQKHETGELNVLVNVHVLTEGWDNSRCDCVIFARSCESPVLWIQAAGRALRPHPGKSDALLLDLRGIAHTLGRPDAEATYSLDGTGIVLAADSCPTGERLCKVCRAPLGDEMVCQTCGKDHTPKVPKAIGAPLTDWDRQWDAARSAVRPGPVVAALAGIMQKAEEAGRAGKPWGSRAASMRFRAIFRRWPKAQEYQQARNFLALAAKFEP